MNSKRTNAVTKLSLVTVSLLLLCLPSRGQAHLPYDFVVEQTDLNGWPLNPKWGAQIPAITNLPNPYKCPGLEPWSIGNCTNTQNWSDKSSLKCPDTAFENVWFPGHINFGGAVVTGTIFWDDHSSNDDDYNISIVPDNGGGLTTTNPQAIRMEFDSDETIDHFHTSWWKSFHGAVDKSSSAAKTLIDGKRAIAFGVMGLDCAHDCSVELHPVFALAVEINDAPGDDTWAIFVRNWGNEGYCSSGTEALDDPISTFTFTIPRAGALAVAETGSEFLCRGEGGSGPSFPTLVPGGATLTFGFPPASKRERINGVVHLKWTLRPPTPIDFNPKHPAPAFNPNLANVKSMGRDPGEQRVESWIGRMTPAQRAVYLKSRPKPEPDNDTIAPQQAQLKVVRHDNKTALVKSTPDPKRDQRDTQELEAIKRAYNGVLPKN